MRDLILHIYCNCYKDTKAERIAPMQYVLYVINLAVNNIGSFQPATSKNDYIDFKTKVGGIILFMSMLQFPFIIIIKASASNGCSIFNLRPEQIMFKCLKNYVL